MSIKRPKMQRTHPYRAFHETFRHRAPAAEEQTEEVDSPNFVEQGVRSAYDVIDRYIQQGQEYARNLGGSGPSPFGDSGDFGTVQSKAMKTYLDLVSNWFDLVGASSQMLMRMGSQGPASPFTDFQAPAFDGPPAGAVHQPRSALHVDDVAYQIHSLLPTRITAELAPDAYGREIGSHGLQSLKIDNPHVIQMRIVTDESSELLVVQIEVPDNAARGAYTGLAIDTMSEEVVGNVRLEVLER